jgi:predicted O-methyltransferase YrrM
MPVLPADLRHLTPARLRDDPRLRALAVGTGLIPPRTMHSAADAAVLLGLAREARRVVEIGVYEGASAIALCQTMRAGSELHLVDPFGRHPDALPSGWGATEWATRRAVARAVRRRGDGGPAVRWHVCLSAQLASRWREEVDLVFVDGDHSEAGCKRDWAEWHPFVGVGGHVVFHDARAGRPGGRGLPGPTAVVDRHFRSGAGDEDGEDGEDKGGGNGGGEDDRSSAWEIVAEADRTVAVRRVR